MEWIIENWFNVLSAVGIIGGLLFTAESLRSETKTRRIANLLTLTQSHRELWSEVIHNQDLARVLDASADLTKQPMNRDQAIFVNLVIQHLASAYEAMKSGLVINPVGVKQDAKEFFALPIARATWKKIKVLQNHDFVDFVEKCLAGAETKG